MTSKDGTRMRESRAARRSSHPALRHRAWRIARCFAAWHYKPFSRRRTRMSRLKRCAIALAAATAALPQLSAAQAYPSKPLKIVSTIPLGGSGDVAVRLAASKASETFGQQILVETNGAAGGTVAARTVMKAA